MGVEKVAVGGSHLSRVWGRVLGSHGRSEDVFILLENLSGRLLMKRRIFML